MLDGSIWLDSGLMGGSGLKRAFLWEIGAKKLSRARFFDMSAGCGGITKHLHCEDSDAQMNIFKKTSTSSDASWRRVKRQAKNGSNISLHLP